jgi:addiction module RelE/StbE family toxin
MYTLVWSSHFTRSAKKFIKKHPDLEARFFAVLHDLASDPFQPHLKYHLLGGNFKGVQAVSITHGYRVTLTVVIAESEIILLDVGTHDEVYR